MTFSSKAVLRDFAAEIAPSIPKDLDAKKPEKKEEKQDKATNKKFEVQQVLSSKKEGLTNVSSNQIHINCPQRILTEFQNLLKGTEILGASFTNPYTGEIETIPSDPKELTARHLQIIARNEAVNTNGKMDVGLYEGLLTADQIAKLRCLVKETTISGIVTAKKYGGYGGPNPKVTEIPGGAKTIIIDQAGLQWQGDYRNTGGMFFYPETADESYKQWQKESYKAMYGAERPERPNGKTMEANF